MKRDGEPDATMALAGISAQKIRHLDILLVDPWVITLDAKNGMPLPSPIDIQVANPLRFMVQKFLIQKYRRVEKQAQDLLYVYATIELFGALLPEFHRQWEDVIKHELGNLSEEVLQVSNATFSSVNDLIRAAARIPRDRKLSPEQVQLTCQIAFEQILGA